MIEKEAAHGSCLNGYFFSFLTFFLFVSACLAVDSVFASLIEV
jgi:hypothetical protein